MAKIDWKSVGGRVRTLTTKVARILFTKDMATFLSFLVLAGLFWVMYNVGARRTTIVKFPVQYVGIPNNILLEHDMPTTIEVVVKDEGQVLMNYKLMSDIDTIPIDLSQQFSNGSPLTVNYHTQNVAIRRRLPETSQIISVKPEMATVDFMLLEQAVVPVRLSKQIPLMPPYVLLDSIRITPALVEVSAPQAVLDTLHFVEAIVEDIAPLSKTATFQFGLKPLAMTRFDADNVEVELPIEISTEKVIDVPIEGRNFPENVSLRAFPSSVKVTCSIGISKFSTLTEADFSAFVDFAEVQASVSDKVPVQVVSTNASVSGIHFSPSEIEFLLEK